MKIIDPALMKKIREQIQCERCCRFDMIFPHHLFCRGMGGARRFDILINLIGLCVWCHQAFHNGRIDREELLAIVAKREKTTPEAIQEEIWRLRRQ